MALCPECRKYYREPEGEDGEHDCPYCGSSGEYEMEDEE